jgi:outer membrane protein
VQTRILRQCFAAALLLIFIGPDMCAQIRISLSLDSAVSLALEKNHLLNIKKLQVEEKQQKVNEDRIKYLPAIVAGGQFQYNTSLPSITIEQGRFGSLPLGTILIPLPAIDEVISMGNHRNYQAGITLYQPITQLGKINAGVGVSRAEYMIAQAEESKAGSR